VALIIYIICLSGYLIMSRSLFPDDFHLQENNAVCGLSSSIFPPCRKAFCDNISLSHVGYPIYSTVRTLPNSTELSIRICSVAGNEFIANR